jgi:hypothetical protein
MERSAATASRIALHEVRILADDERRDAVGDREVDELLHRLGARDVEQSDDLVRQATRADRGGVDRRIARCEITRLQIRERWQPAVAEAAGEAQHPRLVRADPDRDVVCGRRTALGAGEGHELAASNAAAFSDAPELADLPDALGERVDGLTRGPPRPAHGGDRIPEGSGAEAEVEPAIGEQVERGGGLRGHRGWSQGQVEHVRGDVDALGRGPDVRHEGPRVEERRLVRMVLERRKIEAELLAALRELHRALRGARARCDERTESDGVAVVHVAPRIALLDNLYS